MRKISKQTYILSCAALVAFLLGACKTDDELKKPTVFQPIIQMPQEPTARRIDVTRQQIPGKARSENSDPTEGYGPTNVQAQLRIDVGNDTKQVKVVRDNADPYVITKPYQLKQADPYAVRGYLEAAVGAKSVNTSPVEATAVKFSDGTGVVLVSAEEYRFTDSDSEQGIDALVSKLDRAGLTYTGDAQTHIYFPRFGRASNLQDMLLKIGASQDDPQFKISPSQLIVDAELNALMVKAPDWCWNDIRNMLKSYDKPLPEVKVSYQILEIYAENDDRIGVDFQSWKNNDGVDFFSAGSTVRRNWGTFFTSGVQDTANNRTSYWNFNPKWNTRYLDFMTSIGKAKCLAQGVLVAQNRKISTIQVNSGFFYDRTSYLAGASSIAEACDEFAYTEPNPDTIKREALTKIMPYENLKALYAEAKDPAVLLPDGYALRLMGTQTNQNTYGDYSAVLGGATSVLAKYLTGYVKSDGTVVNANYYNTDWNSVDSAPGIIHGWLQYPMATDGFKVEMALRPVVTGEAAQLEFNLNCISLLGWNADGSARTSESSTATTVQIGYDAQEFVIGGLRKSESVRSTAGLPFFKDLPIIGRVFSTESESIKQSQLILIATVERSPVHSLIDDAMQGDLDDIVKGVNKGMNTRVGNMFFQQYGLDSNRASYQEHLNSLEERIDDKYQELK